jgi:hypothetical protein
MHLPPRRPAVLLGDRQPDQQPMRPVLHHVSVAAAPQQRVPLPHQEAVAGMGQGAGVVGPLAAVERPQGEQVPPVVDVVQQPPVSPQRIDRLEQHEVRPELDPAAIVRRRELEIGDRLIRRRARIDLQ